MPFLLPALEAGFAAFADALAAEVSAGLAASSDLAGFAAVFAGEVLAAAGFFAAGVGFFAEFWAGFSAVAEDESADVESEPVGDWPTMGMTAICRESKRARQREARRRMEVGEDATLISPL
jgi:hypothetical protein